MILLEQNNLRFKQELLILRSLVKKELEIKLWVILAYQMFTKTRA